MKTVSAGLQAVIDAGQAQFVLIYKIKLKNGTIYAYTEHDQALDVDLSPLDDDGLVTYLPGTITENSSFDHTTGTRVDSAELSGVTGLINMAGVTRDDILAGRFDGAVITTARVHWPDPTLGGMIEAVHDAGDVTDQDGVFKLSTRSILDRYSAPVTVKIAPECRHVFGGSACGYDLSGQTYSGQISAISDARTFVTSVVQAQDYFAFGRLEFTSGRNAGKIYDILSDDGAGEIALNAPPYLPVAIGDTVTLTRGCRKDRVACEGFDNFARFGGFPDVPGSKLRNQRGTGDA